MNPTTPKSPAEAAFLAAPGHIEIDLPEWEAIAKAANETYLATVAEGLPTVEDIEIASDDMLTELQLHGVRALFAERFAKLQAELASRSATFRLILHHGQCCAKTAGLSIAHRSLESGSAARSLALNPFARQAALPRDSRFQVLVAFKFIGAFVATYVAYHVVQ